MLPGKTAGPFERLMWCGGRCWLLLQKSLRSPTKIFCAAATARSPFPRLFAVAVHAHKQTGCFLISLAAAPTHTCARIQFRNSNPTPPRERERARWSLFTLWPPPRVLSLSLPRGSNLRLGAAGRERNQTPLSEPPSHTHFCSCKSSRVDQRQND